jgi:hypothetical protein
MARDERIAGVGDGGGDGAPLLASPAYYRERLARNIRERRLLRSLLRLAIQDHEWGSIFSRRPDPAVADGGGS